MFMDDDQLKSIQSELDNPNVPEDVKKEIMREVIRQYKDQREIIQGNSNASMNHARMAQRQIGDLKREIEALKVGGVSPDAQRMGLALNHIVELCDNLNYRTNSMFQIRSEATNALGIGE
jgi:transcription elongation GreA/GreB family factor